MTKEEQDQAISQANKKIDEILVENIESWFFNDPVLLGVYTLLNRIPDFKQHTIGISVTSKVPTIKFNPVFINSLSKEKLELVMVVEGFKVLLKHCTTRLKEPAKISGLASSLAINELLNSDLKSILNGLSDIVPDPLKYGLEPNMSFEQYYQGIYDKAEQVSNSLEQMYGKPQEQGNESEDQGNQFKSFDSEKDALSHYFDPSGTSNDEWGENSLLDMDIEDFINKQKDKVKNWGKHTGNSMSSIVASITPKISYKEVLKRFKKSVTAVERISTRMKPNRRYYELDIPGYKRTYSSNIFVFVDISGSMSDEDIAEGLSVINSICKHANVSYGMFDTEIKEIHKDYKKAKKEFHMTGRGGTDYNCICEYVKTVKIDGLIIFTDGFAPIPNSQPKCHTLWLMMNENCQAPIIWPNKCSVAKLKRFENI